MSSPFKPYENSTLTFSVASGALETDALGNVKPSTATVVVKALLKQARDPNRVPVPGVDPTAVWCEGYITEVNSDPENLTLPSSITTDSSCSILWQGRTGSFKLAFTADSPYLAALNINLVNRIRGYFQPGGYLP